MITYNPAAISQALDLIRTPLALEILRDLNEDRSYMEHARDAVVFTLAVNVLRSVGAVTTTLRDAASGAPTVTITVAGRCLLTRLMILELAAEHVFASGV